MNRCYSCFKEYEEQYDICPFCGEVKNTQPKEPIYLYPGTILAERYILGEAVGAGGFGIIYKAWDMKLETIVAVKEFFVSRLMTRAAGAKEVIVNKKSQAEFEYRKTRFLAEARNMARFGTHRSIPNVFEFFEDNGTAYIVMELLHGQGLNEYLQQVNGKVDQDFVLLVANEVGNALISLHEQGIIHRDVAPDNVYICSDKELRIKLLDLGAAKLADTTDDVIDIILKPGYSPVEQYDNTKGIGTWTDVYALGATLYVMLTGIKPDESTNRKINDTVVPPHELDESIPENLSNAIMKAMAIEKHMRFKTVAEFLKALNGEKKVTTLAKERKRRKRRRFTGILAAVLVIAIIATNVFNSYNNKKAEQILNDASISLWFSVNNASTENEAIESIVADFTGKFPNVEIDVRAIPEDQYLAEISLAAEEGTLPTLFESTELTDELLSNATSIKNVLSSEQAESCLFIDQYDKYYSDTKRVPLSIEVPMAFVITKGVTSIEYNDEYYSSISDFGNGTKIAADTEHTELLNSNQITTVGLAAREEFLNNEANTCAVMFSSSMAINEVRETLTNYQKNFVFYSSDNIHCRFTYEWSIGNGTKDEVKAAERLLSWMLGNAYQNTLMISKCNDGQIPINETCFNEKISQKNYSAIKEIYTDFVFERQ